MAGDRIASQVTQEEFIALITASQRRIHGFIRTLVYDTNEIDEVVQETNLALWEQASRFERGTDFMAWACRVAWFKVLESRRRRQRIRLRFSDALLESLAHEALKEPAADDTRYVALIKCMAELPEKHRALLEMHYIKEMSQDAIGRLTNRKANAVAQMLFRIRTLLRDCVARRLGAPDPT